MQKTILLVDDDDLNLTIIEMYLKDEYQVLKALSGREALDLLSNAQNVPDLILLDVLMPEMDGWVVFDKIQDIAALKHTPIMFYTSLDENSAKEKAYELGASDYIVKPCDRSVLLDKIKNTLEKAELQKQEYGI